MIVEVDGQNAHAATGGVALDGDKPVLLMIHGAGMDSTVWQQQTRFLAHRGLRAVAVDLPGHGGSDGEPLTTIADMADWVNRFMDAAGLSPANVAGHSMGSFVALELARRHPAAVTSLTLMGTANAMPVHPQLLSSSADALDDAAALMAAWGHGKAAHIGLNPTPGLWMLGGARALVEMSEPGALTADFTACKDYADAEEAAAAVTCPVQLIVGAEDKMTPPKAAAALAGAMNQDLVSSTVLAGVGHSMMLEDPRSVRTIMLQAATTTPATS
jgi:pimeloyl-ACP methyl ester carboxylesterase